MRIAASVNRTRTVWVLIAAVALPAAMAVNPAAAGATQGSGLVRGCVNAKTRALTIPAGNGGCRAGTRSLSWQATGPAGPAGIPGWGLDVLGTDQGKFFVFTGVVFDGHDLWAAVGPDNMVDEVSPSSRTIIRSLSGGSYGFNSPFGMAAGGGDVWVLNTGDDSVTEIRASDGAFLRKLSGSRYGFSATTALAFAGGRLWATDPTGNSVTEIDPSTGTITGKLAGGKYGFNAPSALDVTGSHVWVANTAGNSVTEVSASNGAFVRRLDGFTGPGVMASTGNQLWVLGNANDPSDPGSATEINADTGTAIRRVDGTGLHLGLPFAAVVTGGRLWVSSFSSGAGGGVTPNTVSEIDTSDGAFVRTVANPSVAEPFGLALVGQHVWMTSNNALVELPADGPAAAGPSVRGCVGGHTRALTIPAAGKSCGSGSTPIGWAQDGPPGPAGAAGWPQVVTGASYGFDSPDSVTATSGQLWVTNPKGNSLTEISDADGALVRRVAGRQYGFSAPVAATTNGNRLWVANLDGDSVTEINASDGSVVRVISGAKYSFHQPVALTYESGDVWVVNAVGNSVTELSAADGSLVRVISTTGEFSRPVAIAGDGTDLWVTNSNGNSVTELRGSDGSLVRTLSSGDNFSAPDSVAVSSDHLWVASKSNCTVSELNTSDGSLIRNREICSDPRDGSPEEIIADAAYVWITIRGPSELNDSTGVTELDATDGTFIRQIGDDGDGFSFASPFPAGLTEAGGHVWVANPGGKTVTKLPQAGPAAVPATAVHACVNSSTRAVTVPASGSGCPAAATAITWNQPGPAGAGTDPDLEPVFSGTPYQFNDPEAMASDGSHLFIANAGGNALTEVNASDGSLVRIVQGPSYAFSRPEAMVFDGTDLWVANAGGNSVTEIDPSDGSLVRNVTGPSFAFSQPNAMVFDGSHLWVASSAGNSLTEINASDGSLVRVVSGSGYAFSSPSSLAFDGSNIWVSNSGGGSITELSAADGSLVRTISGGNYQLDDPGALVFDGGRIWVANGSNDELVTVINASDGSLAGVVPLLCGGEQLTVDGSRVLAGCGGVTELRLGTDFARPLGDAEDLGIAGTRAMVVVGGHLWEASSVPNPNAPVASLAELPLG